MSFIEGSLHLKTEIIQCILLGRTMANYVTISPTPASGQIYQVTKRACNKI